MIKAWPRRLLCAGLASALLAQAAAAAQLQPFKDDLFAYPGLTAYLDGGDRVDVDYSEQRDIDARDEVPERRVKARYVDLSPLGTQAEESVPTAAGPLKIMRVGEARNPSAILLFIHGRNGDRRLGMNDMTFGGNFNRLKNLMTRAGGLYVTADAGRFDASDKTRVSGLVETLANAHPDARFVLACASMGGEFCWDILGEPAIAGKTAAIVMLSANTVPAKVEAMRKAAGGRRIPLLLAHGTRDKVFAWDSARSLYSSLHGSGYPVRFVSFDGGNHGTPIRMIDWRDTLNWLFERPG